jgi:hypothetical protein
MIWAQWHIQGLGGTVGSCLRAVLAFMSHKTLHIALASL